VGYGQRGVSGGTADAVSLALNKFPGGLTVVESHLCAKCAQRWGTHLMEWLNLLPAGLQLRQYLAGDLFQGFEYAYALERYRLDYRLILLAELFV
jgi:hypothetical protein